jgi:hypothetical protein
MSSIDSVAPVAPVPPGVVEKPRVVEVVRPGLKIVGADGRPDIVAPDAQRKTERFLPVTRFALIERLTRTELWPAGQAQRARRFFRYLDYWRRQQYTAVLGELERDYEPFSPDTDLLLTRAFTAEEKKAMQRRAVDGIEKLLGQANYVRVDPANVQIIMTQDSHYGLDLHVDLDAFEELALYYRGASTRKDQRRTLRKFMRKEEFDVPIFQRLFLLFKLKPFERRVADLMSREKLSRSAAEKRVKKMRALLPAQVSDENIYIKLFKNMPRSDLEMVFPNTQVRFRLMDKLKLGLTGGAGLGMGIFSAAGKLALAFTNPVAAAGAVAGLSGIAFRQAMNFVNQRQRYMVVMAQNLYFHSLADNRGVMIKLADRAAEEDVKEEILLYAVLAKEVVYRHELPAVDRAVENYLREAFGVDVDFDLEDALARLKADGLVNEQQDGRLVALGPADATLHIDALWDGYLDRLADDEAEEGQEIDRSAGLAQLDPHRRMAEFKTA